MRTLAAALLAQHWEAELVYIPTKGFMSGGLALSQERTPFWVKIDGRPERIVTPTLEAVDQVERGELDLLWTWVDQGHERESDKGRPPSPHKTIAASQLCQVSWDTPQETTTCEDCGGSGVREERDCYCKGDPRCKRCNGTGRFVPSCYSCDGRGELDQIFYLRLIEDAGTREIALRPQLMHELALGEFDHAYVFPIERTLVWRKETGGPWRDAYDIAGRVPRPPTEGKPASKYPAGKSWRDRLMYTVGRTSQEHPLTVWTAPLADERESLSSIVGVCDRLRVGLRLVYAEGVMGTGESGWSVQLIRRTGYSPLAAWYDLPLALMNGAAAFASYEDEVLERRAKREAGE